MTTDNLRCLHSNITHYFDDTFVPETCSGLSEKRSLTTSGHMDRPRHRVLVTGVEVLLLSTSPTVFV